jgi:hypothetical protein
MVLLKVILGLVGLTVGFVAFVLLGWLILPAAGIVLALSTGARDKLVRRLPAVGRLRPGALGLLVGLGGLMLSGGYVAVLMKTTPMQTATTPTATTLPPATPVAAAFPTHARATSTPTSVSPTAAANPFNRAAAGAEAGRPNLHPVRCAEANGWRPVPPARSELPTDPPHQG